MKRRASWPSVLLPMLLLVAGLVASGGTADSAGSSQPTLHMTVTNR